MIVTQYLADPRLRVRPDFWAQRHERVERRSRKHAKRADIEPGVLLELPQIEHIIADRNTNTWGEAIAGGEHPIGEILDREVGGGIDRDEGAEAGVVGVGHGIIPAKLSTNSIVVIPGCDHPGASPESILPIVVTDSGLSLREPRNDGGYGRFGSNLFSRPFQQSALSSLKGGHFAACSVAD